MQHRELYRTRPLGQIIDNQICPKSKQFYWTPVTVDGMDNVHEHTWLATFQLFSNPPPIIGLKTTLLKWTEMQYSAKVNDKYVCNENNI